MEEAYGELMIATIVAVVGTGGWSSRTYTLVF